MRKIPPFQLGMIMIWFASLAGQSATGKEPQTAPFGSWKSPITTQMLVRGQVRMGDVSLDGQTLYWSEMRPEEGGRYAVVRRAPDGSTQDVLPAPWSVRSLVHEYGGGAMLASAGTIYFCNYDDQRIWTLVPGNEPQPLTEQATLRFADFVLDRTRRRLICICEDHSHQGKEPTNRLVSVNLDDGGIETLAEGWDFYSSACLSPDEDRLAWLCWNHPNMPWDDSELFVAAFNPDGSLQEPRHVAGGKDESIFQPDWSPDGTLYFVSDRTNWWNLYRERDGRVEAVLPMEAEFGRPQWVFGMTTYGFDGQGNIVATFTRDGTWHLTQLDADKGTHDDWQLPYTYIGSLHVGHDKAYAEVSSPAEPVSLVELNLTDRRHQVIRRSSPEKADPAYTSIPEPVEFPTDGNRTAHAFYYPPANQDFRGPDGQAPPVLVIVHGGPTSAARAEFRLRVQYWTSRGLAVCDVNYGGSTGYGREYRNRLRESWGIVDIADAANAASYLAQQGKADPEKLIIRGGSAGGYTTLAALAFRDVFCCGASHYGVSDLALLAEDTHKFESRYLDRLVGPYPQDAQRYRERSPMEHLDGFNRPVILLQGLEDKIVPPNQAELILESLRQKGVPVAYVPFPGEQHGFRKAESIMRAHEAELYFYSRVLGFSLPEAVEPVEIHNLP